MVECLKCIYKEVCKTAESCDGYVSGCEHFNEQKQVRMDVREKLWRFVKEAIHSWESDVNMSDHITDNLIAHGVTVQEWISVKDRLPQEDEPTGIICEQVQVLLRDGFVTTGWCNRGAKAWYFLPYGDTHFYGHDYDNTPVVAWQPLAEPPKGA